MLAFFALAVISPDLTANQIFSRIHQEVLDIDCTTASGAKVSGTAFYFHGHDAVVTAYHIVKRATQIALRDFRHKALPLPPYIKYDEEQDIAVFYNDGSKSFSLMNEASSLEWTSQFADSRNRAVTAEFDAYPSPSDIEFARGLKPELIPKIAPLTKDEIAALEPMGFPARPGKGKRIELPRTLAVRCHATLAAAPYNSVAVGEPLYVIGSPDGFSQTISPGIVSAKRMSNGVPLLQITAPVSHGSSGSPVVNAKGDLLAVVDSTIENGQNLNFAVSASEILFTLSKIEAPTESYTFLVSNMARI